MPDAFVINQRFNTYGAAMSALVEMLVSAGWAYKASGDGLAGYSSTGKVFTGVGSGALGWGNNRAWCRLSDPAARRELVVQHNNAAGARIKISTNNKFVGGAPSATVTPSATDERVLWGAGTDATPTLSAWFHANMLATGFWVFQGAALGSAPYGFWFGSQQLHQSVHASFLMMDPVVGVPEDPDPVVWSCQSANACDVTTASIGRDGNTVGTWTVTSGGTNQGCFAHMYTPSGPVAGTPAQSFVYVQPASYGLASIGAAITYQAGGPGSSVVGINPINYGVDALPCLYMRMRVPATLAPWGIKGWSTMTMWTGISRQSFFDVLDDKRWVCYGDLWLRWNGESQPIG